MTPAIAQALEAHTQHIAELRQKVARAKHMMREGSDLKQAALAVDLSASELDRLLWKTRGNPMKDIARG